MNPQPHRACFPVVNDEQRSDRSRALGAHGLAVRNCRRLFATSPPDFRQAVVQEEYRRYLSAFYGNAMKTSRDREFSADPDTYRKPPDRRTGAGELISYLSALRVPRRFDPLSWLDRRCRFLPACPADRIVVRF